MGEKKKNRSFLFSLYKRTRREEDEPEEQEEQSAQKPESAAQAEPQPVPEEPRTLPPKRKYIESLFQWYRSFPELQDPALKEAVDFANYVLLPVAERPGLALLESTFGRKLGASAEQALAKLRKGEENRRIQRELANRLRGELEREAAMRLADGEDAEPARELTEEEQVLLNWEEEPPAPEDGELFLHTAADKMSIYAFVTPPRNGGKPVTRELLSSRLEEKQIVHGIKEDALEMLPRPSSWMRIYLLAEGTPPVNGKDGQAVPVIETTARSALPDDDLAPVDYKNVTILPNVEKGEVICILIPPEKGTDGTNIMGQKVPATAGKELAPPMGDNVQLSEDKTKLVAKTAGQLSVRGDRYYVTPVFEVHGDVDYSIGNVDFFGDVVVRGDVRDGFTIKAGGNLTVWGVVEDATLIAGGNVTLQKGMNGGENGSIQSGGDVYSKFLENCLVYAEGDVRIGSMVAGEIHCGGSVDATERPGALIGGSIHARYHVEARTIGSVSHRGLKITLGVHPREKEIRAETEARSREVAKTLQMLEKNITYLTRMGEQLTPQKRALLKTMLQQKDLYNKETEKLQADLEGLYVKPENLRDCWVRAQTIHEPTKVVIGIETYSVVRELSATRLYMSSEGKIVEGIV